MKTFTIFSTFLILSFFGFLTNGVSQITCPLVDTTCTIQNFDFSKYFNKGDSNFVLAVVPDSVCSWNYYANNTAPCDKQPYEEIYFECENFGASHVLVIDPECSGDSNQFYQEIPHEIREFGNYTFTMKYELAKCSTDIYIIYACLTNDDPSHKCFPYSSQRKLFDSRDSSNLKNGFHNFSTTVNIAQHYKYIVINFTLQYRDLIVMML